MKVEVEVEVEVGKRNPSGLDFQSMSLVNQDPPVFLIPLPLLIFPNL